MLYFNRLLVGTILCLAILLVAGSGPNASAATSDEPRATIFYPGQLSAEDGEPVNDGMYEFQFTLYPSATGGEAVWSERQASVPVSDGAFVTHLGRESRFSPEALQHGTLWLAVSVRGPGDAGFTLLSPRQEQQMPGSAEMAATAAGPSCAHDHVGEVWTANVDWSNGVLKVENSSNGPSLWGVNSGGGNAVRGDGYGTSLGVYGEGANAAGVVGRSAQKNGVEGFASTTGTGVFGQSKDGTGVYGRSDNQVGVYAEGPVFGLYSKGDLKVEGDLYATGSKSGFVVDIARSDDTAHLETGDVVVIAGVGPAVLGDIPVLLVHKAMEAESTAVVGIVHAGYDPKTGTASGADRIEPQGYLRIVTVGAYRGVKVDATFGSVAAGDLLVASPNPGLAMRADAPKPGTVVGKALGELSSGTGLVPVLVTLQ